MKREEFLARALFHIHGILTICGYSNARETYFLAMKHRGYVTKGYSLYPRFPQPQFSTLNFARTRDIEYLLVDLLVGTVGDLYSSLYGILTKAYDSIVQDLENVHTILLGKNTEPLDVKRISVSVLNGRYNSKLHNKIAQNTTAGVRYRKLKAVLPIVPYPCLSMDRESIGYYAGLCIRSKVPRKLILSSFSFEELESSGHTEIVHWLRMAPLYAAVYRYDRAAPIHRMTLDALGVVMLKLN